MKIVGSSSIKKLKVCFVLTIILFQDIFDLFYLVVYIPQLSVNLLVPPPRLLRYRDQVSGLLVILFLNHLVLTDLG